MKGVWLCIAAIIATGLLGCGNGNDSTSQSVSDRQLKDTANYTQVQWLDSVVNFGSIPMGETIKLRYRFTNTGTRPLFVTHVRAGCGCTVADYTKDAIAPGGMGEITAAFDSRKSQPGNVRKVVVVHTNTSPVNEHTLIFTGEVKPSGN